MTNRFLTLFSALVLFTGCSKNTDKPGSANDSLLAKPMEVERVPEMVTRDTASGLVIDQSRFRTPEHEALLKRFEPLEVVGVYHNFKSIRKPGITKDQLDSFTKANKVSIDELKAILEEGDRLGWAKH